MNWWDIYFRLKAMNWNIILNWTIRGVILLIVGLLIFTLRKFKKTKEYEFRICEMKSGIDIWTTVNKPGLDFKWKGKKIKPDSLFKIRPSLGLRIKWLLNNVPGGFLIIFPDGKNEPVKYAKPTTSAETLLKIHESRALGRALKDEFSQALGGKSIFIVIAVIAVAVVIYYYMTGRIG